MFMPDYVYETVYDIPMELFTENGIKCLFFDIDNTLVPYEEPKPTKENLEFFERLESAGIKIIFVSNNHEDRVKEYAEGLPYLYAYDAGKPGIKKYKALAESCGADISECGAVGDQIFTDVVAASRLGIKSFLVSPIKDKTTLFFKTKRFLEKPFLYAYRKREATKSMGGKV